MSKSTTPFTARDVVNVLGSAVRWTTGDLSRALDSAASLGGANARSLAYCRYEGEKLHAALDTTSAGTVIITDDDTAKVRATRATLIAVDRPRLSFIKAVASFMPEAVRKPGIAPSAIVDATARVDPQAEVAAGVLIGPSCIVGARTVIGPYCVLRSNVRIGTDCAIDASCVLGLDGFSFEADSEGRPVDLPHLGGVVIGNNVRVGAHSCVDRGTLDDTAIEDDVRIDNHAQISHNCRIAKRSVLCSFVVLGGSVTIGADVWVSPHVVVRNQIKVGDRAVLGLGSVVMADVAAGDNMLGNPARRVPTLRNVRSTTQ